MLLNFGLFWKKSCPQELWKNAQSGHTVTANQSRQSNARSLGLLLLIDASVTRLGDLLDIRQLFKAFGNT